MRRVRVLTAEERTERVQHPYSHPDKYPYLEAGEVYQVGVHILDGWRTPMYGGDLIHHGEGIVLAARGIHGAEYDYPWVFDMARFEWTDEALTRHSLVGGRG